MSLHVDLPPSRRLLADQARFHWPTAAQKFGDNLSPFGQE
jgi:hypothetical protein